jgi:pimeloyl-ACP methyl ester carboxylesterase
MPDRSSIYRTRTGPDDNIGYVHSGNRRAVFFIHGLGGDNSDDYWGRLIELLNYDDRLIQFDFFYFRYKSSRLPNFPLFILDSTHDRISTVPEVSLALLNAVRLVERRHRYRRISILGHSLGGLIGLMSARDLIAQDGKFPLRNVCLLATPMYDVWLATTAALAYVFEEINPHIHFLSRQKRIQEVLESGTTMLRDEGRKVYYIHCIGDSLLWLYHGHDFSEFIAMQGPHRVMSLIDDREHGAYQTIASFIIDHC